MYFEYSVNGYTIFHHYKKHAISSFFFYEMKKVAF